MTCPNDGHVLFRVVGAPERNIGRVIDGRFTIVELIGAGGMGTVYRASQKSLGRDVALKLMRNESPELEDAKRFLRAARLASKLTHPNIVATLDLGQTDAGLLYVVMELLQGRTLAKLIDDEGPLPIERAISIAMQICDALVVAHGASLIHRDLKPSNIIVLDEPKDRDFIKVLDFGLAKSLMQEGHSITETGRVLGTPRYMAPEIFQGEDASPASDLYAVGIILLELLAGKSAVVDPATVDTPAVVQNILLKLLAARPNDRFDSAATFAEALAAARESLGKSRVASARSEMQLISSIPVSAERVARGVEGPTISVVSDRRVDRRRPWTLALGALLIAASSWIFLRDDPQIAIEPDLEPITVAPIAECTGRAPMKNTAWRQHDTNTVALDVDTSTCGFASTPSYFTTLYGSGYQYLTRGANALVHTSSAGFSVHVVSQAGPVTPELANQRAWSIEWRALPRAQKSAETDPEVCTGRTRAGATAWIQDPSTKSGLYVDINTSDCGFTSTPRYFTSIEGRSRQADVIGGTSIYLPTATGFRVYAYLLGGAITPKEANAIGLRVNWNASLAGARTSKLCVGNTLASTWVRYPRGPGLYTDVDISSCGLSNIPRIFTSMGGKWGHWATTGATSIYLPGSRSFRVHVTSVSDRNSVQQALEDGWHINWAVVDEH